LRKGGTTMKGGTRCNALWGKGARGALVLLALSLVLPAAAQADQGKGSSRAAFASKSLRDAAKASPEQTFRVIVDGVDGVSTAAVASAVERASSGKGKPKVKRKFSKALNGVVAELSGAQLEQLLASPLVASVVADAKVAATAEGGGFSNDQLWPDALDSTSLWSPTSTAPGIAIVDSGIDPSRAADFGGRVVARATFYDAGGTNSEGDGRGHGTLVASVAAGSAPGYAGVSPTSSLIDLDVLGDDGSGTMSDVVAAADWILANKDAYNIRVANFSLHGGSDSSFMYDPVNQAVERLWFAGVVVVAAAGNYGENGAPSGVRFAPGNDPFVITVGAADIAGTAETSDDFAAPWSAYGTTHDGFAKPELGAPGRVMNGAVPVGSSLYSLFPERVVAEGYQWMSGTSFAAPAVAGAAAQLLAQHPSWTPDQVKGALMVSAQPAGAAAPGSLGVGMARAAAAAAVVDPPNPNAGLNQFLVTDSTTGGQSFDSASWSSAAQSDASWSSASWSSASWSSASWSSASWSSASWSSASWSSASWSSASWSSASWNSASWNSATSLQ
jgi:serine protease AprX